MSTTLPRQNREAELLARFRKGDSASFDGIVREFRADLYRVALRILGHHDRADEAVQESLVRAWKGLARFRGESALRTWLIRIVVNVARTMMRSRREGGDPPDDRVVDPAEGTESRIAKKQLRRRVRTAVAKLPPRQREVVWLKVFCELTHQEVASAMGITEGAAKAHLHQAVANLRRRMASEESGS